MSLLTYLLTYLLYNIPNVFVTFNFKISQTILFTGTLGHSKLNILYNASNRFCRANVVANLNFPTVSISVVSIHCNPFDIRYTMFGLCTVLCQMIV